SFNKYTYALNNPLKFADPTGLYVTNCGDNEACQESAAAFEKARQANLERGGDIRDTSLAYGEPGEENGVTVAFGESEPGSSANVEAKINYNQDTGFSLEATVTIDPSLSGTKLEAMVGHEGQHLADAQAFVATFTAAGYFDLSNNLTLRQTETKAFWVTHRILEASQTPMYFQGQHGDVKLGMKAPRAEIERGVQQIINGPLYSRRLDNRQFPNYDYQP
ncbi:MAG: hypothetical protein GY832_20390, partial [Chloroflexi bacterium]|nr:hypothetical protein [Chloroflexota bacterium]